MAAIRKPKNIKGLTKEKYEERINKFNYWIEFYENQPIEELHVFISDKNAKAGASVSFLPIINCGNCEYCGRLCYDFRNDCCYESVIKTRAKNWVIWQKDPDRFFEEINKYIKYYECRDFRWFVGGDIPSYDFYKRMITLVKENPDTEFLDFTKMFHIVNKWIDENGKDASCLPTNMHQLFSGWYGQPMNNPYNLPTSHPLFGDGRTSAEDGAKLCTGDCTECRKEKKLCFAVKCGEQIVFNAH